MVTGIKSSTEKPVLDVGPEVKERAQGAIARLLAAMRGDPRAYIFFYNIVGPNKGSLLHRMGIRALEYCALMLVAGLMEFQKVPNEERYRLTSKRAPWENFIGKYMLSDFVEWTTYRMDYEESVGGELTKKQTPPIGFVRLGHAGKNPPKYKSDRNLNRDMQPGDQIRDNDIFPPRLNISSAFEDFYEEIASVVGHGYGALDFSVTADMLEQGKYLMTDADREALDAAAAAVAELSDDDDDESDDESFGSKDASDGDDDSFADVSDEEGARQLKKAPTPRPCPVLRAGVSPMENPIDPENKAVLMSLYGECHASLATIQGGKKSRTTEATLTNGKSGKFVHVLPANYDDGEEKGERRFLRSSITVNKRAHLAKLPKVKKHSDKNREIKKRASAKADEAVDLKRTKREDAINN